MNNHRIKTMLLAALLGLATLTMTMAAPVAAEEEPAAAGPDIYYQGELVVFPDQQPIIHQNRTLVPVRGILEIMGAQVDWYANIRYVEITFDGGYISLYLGNPMIRMNRPDADSATGYRTQEYLTDVAPQIIGDRTMVPLRILSELMGLKVDWVDGAVYIEEMPDPIVVFYRQAGDAEYTQREIDPKQFDYVEPTAQTVAEQLNATYLTEGDNQVVIASATLEGDRVTVDFSQFATRGGQKPSISQESAILDSVTLTFTRNLTPPSQVYFLLNGEDYESDNVSRVDMPWQLTTPANAAPDHTAPPADEPLADSADETLADEDETAVEVIRVKR